MSRPRVLLVPSLTELEWEVRPLIEAFFNSIMIAVISTTSVFSTCFTARRDSSAVGMRESAVRYRISTRSASLGLRA